METECPLQIDMPYRIWLSINEAAKRAGVTRQSLQQAMDRGELTRFIVHTPHKAIARVATDLEELDQWIANRPKRPQE